MLQGFIVAVLGAIAGSLVTWFISQRDKSFETTFSLHDEFFSSDMLRARGIADNYLMENQGTHFRELYYSGDIDKMDSVFIVAEFYERLYLAFKHRRVRKPMATELFAEIFIYWYINYFKKGMAQSNWAAEKRLGELFEIFRNELDETSFKRLVARAESEIIESHAVRTRN